MRIEGDREIQHGRADERWADADAVTTVIPRYRTGPLASVHRRQLRWHPIARLCWWALLLPLAVFAWSSSRLRGPARAVGYLVAAFVLLVGVVGVTADPSPPAAAPVVAVQPAAPAPAAPAIPARAPVAIPAAIPAPPLLTTPPARPAASAPTARRTTPASAYAVPPRPRVTATVPRSTSSGSDTYTNVDGNQVQRPVAAASRPSGATAKCQDGTWSFSQHRSGTCSGHGGVSQWL